MKGLKTYEKVLIASLLLTTVLSLIVPLTRTLKEYPSPPLGESYLNLRMAGEIAKNSKLEEDPLQGRPLNPSPYQYLLSLIGAPSSSRGVALLTTINLLASLATLLYLYRLTRLFSSKESAAFAALVYSLSPLTLLASVTFTNLALIGLLFASATYYFARKDRKYVAPGFLLSVMSLEAAAAWVFLSALMSQAREASFKKAWRSFYPAFTVAATGWLVRGVLLGFNPALVVRGGLGIQGLITDLGSREGFSFFAALLAVTAFFAYWDSLGLKSVAPLATLVLAAIISSPVKQVTNLVISALGGAALAYLYKKRWELPDLKDLTIMAVLAGLLFSSLSFAHRLTVSEPELATQKVLESLKQEEQGVVFNTPRDGFFVEYFANKQAFLDDQSPLYADYEKREEALNRLLSSRDAGLTKSVMSREGIKYVYVSDSSSDLFKNLLFVMRASENYIKIAGFKEKEVWLYIPSEAR